MSWSQAYTQEITPNLEQIEAYIDSSYWGELLKFIEHTYHLEPSIEYSKCSAARGWNVKYKKGNRSLCTLYPAKGSFTCMIAIGNKEVLEAELLLPSCSSYLQDLYQNTNACNGSRWLMINVTSKVILEDVKKLMYIRMPLKNK